jgi:hypothetical protein
MRPSEIEEKCKWRSYHNDEMISGSMNKRIKEIVEQHHIKMYFQSKAHATSPWAMQTRRQQKGPVGTQTRHEDTRNSDRSMDEQTWQQNIPMGSNHTMVPTRTTTREQRQKNSKAEGKT